MSDKVTEGTCKGQARSGVGSARRQAQMCMAFIEDEGRERRNYEDNTLQVCFHCIPSSSLVHKTFTTCVLGPLLGRI
jgi:hypothetical protein